MLLALTLGLSPIEGQVPPLDTYIHALPYPHRSVTSAYKRITIPTHTGTLAYKSISHPLFLLSYRQVRIKLHFFYFPRKVEVGKQCDTNYDQLLTGSLPLWSNKQLVSLGWGSWRASLCRLSLSFQFKYWLVQLDLRMTQHGSLPDTASRYPPSHPPSHIPHTLSLPDLPLPSTLLHDPCWVFPMALLRDATPPCFS